MPKQKIWPEKPDKSIFVFPAIFAAIGLFVMDSGNARNAYLLAGGIWFFIASVWHAYDHGKWEVKYKLLNQPLMSKELRDQIGFWLQD